MFYNFESLLDRIFIELIYFPYIFKIGVISPVTLASSNPAEGTNKLTLQGLDNSRRNSFEIIRLIGIVSRSFHFFSLPSFRAFVKGYILFQISNNCLIQ